MFLSTFRVERAGLSTLNEGQVVDARVGPVHVLSVALAHRPGQCSGSIATPPTADELDNLLKLARPELGRDLVDAFLMEQQN
jgi:hypothetical protein